MPIFSIKLRWAIYEKRIRNPMKVAAITSLIAVFLSLGIALNGLIDKEIAYAFAALLFILIWIVVLRKYFGVVMRSINISLNIKFELDTAITSLFIRKKLNNTKSLNPSTCRDQTPLGPCQSCPFIYDK